MNELIEKYGHCYCRSFDKKCTITFSNAQEEEVFVVNPTKMFYGEDGTKCIFDVKHRAHIIQKDFTDHHIEYEDI